MSESSATLAGRRFAEQRMTDTVKITRETGVTVDDAGENVPTFSTIYEGPCRLRFTSPRVFKVEAAGQLLAEERPILSVPVGGAGSGAVKYGDKGVITAVGADAGDSAMVGMLITVGFPHAQTSATARRFECEVLS